MLQQYCMLKREIWICLNTQLPFAVLLILLFFFWFFLVSANMRLHVQALSLRILLLFFFDFPFGPLFLPFPYVSCPLSPSSFFPPRAHGWNVVCTQHTKKKGGRRSTEAQRKVHPWKFRCQEHTKYPVQHMAKHVSLELQYTQNHNTPYRCRPISNCT